MRAQQRPAGDTGLSLVRHPHAACVHEAPVADDPVELDVGVAADDHLLADAVQHRIEPLGRGDGRDDLLVASGRAVAKEDWPQAVHVEAQRVRPAAHECELLLAQLLSDPPDALSPGIVGARSACDCAISVPADEGRAPLPQTLEALGRHRAEHQVASAKDDVRVDLAEHRFEGGQVAVDVVEGGDTH